MIRKILLGIVIGFVLIQLIPVNRTNKPVKKNEDFVVLMNTPEKVTEILKKSCYDCHSNETRYPAYAYVAPFSWSVKNHINEGREHLNFSEWATFNRDLKKNMLGNTAEVLRNKEMPMPAYLALHPEANLTDAQRAIAAKYFEDLLASGKF